MADQVTLCFERLPSLTSLDIDDFDWECLDLECQTRFLACFSTVEILNVQGLRVESLLSMVQIIRAFPLLRGLALCNIGWALTDESSRAVNKLSPPPHLRSLRLSDCYKRDILDWLMREPMPRVEFLSLGIIFSADAQSIGNYLRRDGPFIVRLTFGFSDMNAGGDAGRCIIYNHTVYQ